MFEDSLIESGGKLKTKRGMTTIILVHLRDRSGRGPGPYPAALH